MAGRFDYSESCDYIRDEFSLGNNASIYDIVNVITKAYKELKGKQKSAKAETKTEEKKCPTRQTRKKKKS